MGLKQPMMYEMPPPPAVDPEVAKKEATRNPTAGHLPKVWVPFWSPKSMKSRRKSDFCMNFGRLGL